MFWFFFLYLYSGLFFYLRKIKNHNMSDPSNVIESYTPNRLEQLQIWDRLPLTDEQRVRVLQAMREEAYASSEATSGSGLDEDQKEELRDVSQAEVEVEKTTFDN